MTRLTKSECRLLGELNELWRRYYSQWQMCSDQADTALKCFRLVRRIMKSIEEQWRGFLRSPLPYVEAGIFIVQHSDFDYKSLHEGVCTILLGMRPNNTETTDSSYEVSQMEHLPPQ